MWRVIGIVLVVTLGGCAPKILPAVIDTGCDWTRTLPWSVQDTPQTVRGIQEANATRATRCPEERDDETAPAD